MSNFLQLSVRFLFADTMAPFKLYEHLSELVKMYPSLYNKQEKDCKTRSKTESLERNSQGTRPTKW